MHGLVVDQSSVGAAGYVVAGEAVLDRGYEAWQGGRLIIDNLGDDPEVHLAVIAARAHDLAAAG